MLDCEWLARFAAAVGVLGVFIASALAVNAQSPIEIEEIKFEPVGPGKNVVHVVAKNASSIDRMLMVVVAARSPGTREVKKGEMGVGYPQFRDGAYIDHGANLKAGQSNDIRYPFEIPEPIAPRSLIAIQLFDSKAANPMNAFATKQFLAGDLPQRGGKWEQLPAASDDDATAAKELLTEAQLRLRLGLYGRAQQLFTSDWQFVENTPLREWFRRRLYPTDPRAYRWDASAFLQFQPRQVLMRDDKLVLLAAYKDQVWPIEIAKEDGRWLIDWVYTAKEAKGLKR